MTSRNLNLPLYLRRMLLVPGAAANRAYPVNRSIHTCAPVLGNGGPAGWGGQMGSGAGKGGGSGGSIRDAGGSFGRMEAAREDEFFYKMQKNQLNQLREQIGKEMAFHEEQIKHHKEAIERHLKKEKELYVEEALRGERLAQNKPHTS